MSVIIRLQNLPWSANALDIRQFFKGLSIPDGGVHIVGGEMGDAFIAFSTDEDARQAMMHDREKINEVQVRLLLSSRAEMQKVIETARQQSLLALKNAASLGQMKTASAAAAAATPKPLSTPQPPVITPSSLHNILSTSAAPSFLAYQKQAGITLIEPPKETTSTAAESATSSHRSSTAEKSRDRRRSSSRDRRRSRSRDRNDHSDRSSSRRGRRDRSRSRSRDRDWKSRRSSRRSRSRDRTSDRNRDRSADRSRGSSSRSNPPNRERDNGNKSGKDSAQSTSVKAPRFTDVNENSNSAKVASISAWGIPPINSYQTNTAVNNSTAPPASSTGFSLPSTGLNILNPFAISGVRTTPLTNSYTSTTASVSTDSQSNVAGPNASTTNTVAIPAFQNYSTSSSSANNYTISLFNPTPGGSDPSKNFAFQNPYTAAIQQSPIAMGASPLQSTSSATASPQQSVTQQTPSATNAAAAPANNNTMFPGLTLMDKHPTAGDMTLPGANPPTAPVTNFTTANQLPQEPIAFANTNPYAQMYPNLFAQAAATAPLAKPSGIQQPKPYEQQRNKEPSRESCCVKISNMCSSTTYSDVRKFLGGLFIPHNGIKMVNDKHGSRIGVAYIQFSRVSSVYKAMTRNNTFLKTQTVKIEIVDDDEFERAEDSYRPAGGRFDRNDRNYQDNRGDNDGPYDDNNDGGNFKYRNDSDRSSDFDSEPYTVLCIEELPSSASEHDIMRMFSSYTILDILLTPSRENRREFKCHVLFSRAEEAKAAFEDKSTHSIGYRKVRVRPVALREMEREKEKIRLANEQLKKEEEALAESQRLKDEEEAERNLDEQQANLGGDLDMDVADDTNSCNGAETMDNNNGAPQQQQQEYSYAQSEGRPPNFADPRTARIPSLFDLPPIRSSDDMQQDDNDNGRSEGPSDPRLRRQKPSRFAPVNEESAAENRNFEMSGNVGDNMNNADNVDMSGGDNNIGTGNDDNMGMNNNNNNNSDMGMNNNNNNSDMGMHNNNNDMGMNNNSNMPMGMDMGMGMGMNMNMNMNMANTNTNNMDNINMNFSGLENNFILMKNCEYSTRIHDVAELFQSALLRLKHIELLRGDRNLPTGEFIVEFQDARDAETAIRKFGNTTFRQRKVRISQIMPQEIADRIGKPFMNCYPREGRGGGGGGRGGDGGRFHGRSRFGNNDGPPYGGGGRYMGRSGGRHDRSNMDDRRGGGGRSRDDHLMRRRNSRFNTSASSQDGHSDDDVHVIGDNTNDVVEQRPLGNTGDSNGDNGDNGDGGNGGNVGSGNGDDDGVDDGNGGDDSNEIPEKFSRPGCVVAMENVPYKADLGDILKFFSGYDLTPDDIIRRFNDDGTPTGDARVAFPTPSLARSAYNSRRRKQIFGRTIHLTLL